VVITYEIEFLKEELNYSQREVRKQVGYQLRKQKSFLKREVLRFPILETFRKE